MPDPVRPLDARQTNPLEGGASFSLGNRLLRVVWMATWLVLARYTPPPLHGWRRMVTLAMPARRDAMGGPAPVAEPA